MTLPGIGPGSIGRKAGEELAQGTRVGEFEIQRVIGHGGMGYVYEAVHPVIGKKAAVKVVRAELSAVPEAVERFIQEAQATNQIAHPNIVDIFSIGSLPDGRPYFIMELLRGESVAQRIRRAKLSYTDALEILIVVCRALEATHRNGIIHRDLKPENVFIDDRGDVPTVKLLDFGIAKLVRPDTGPVNLTRDGSTLGTPSYVSPEMARGKHVDAAADVYSLGVMAYEMFLGQLPFVADNAVDLFVMHANTPPPRARTLWDEVPEALDELLLCMIDKNPAQRPNVRAVRETLTMLAQQGPGATSSWVPITTQEIPQIAIALPTRHPRETTGSVSRAWSPLIFVGVGALLILGLVVVAIFRETPPSTSATTEHPVAAPVIAVPARPTVPPVSTVPPAPPAVAAPIAPVIPPPPPHTKKARTDAVGPKSPHRPASSSDDDGAIDPYAR